jgi:hypothetical protein
LRVKQDRTDSLPADKTARILSNKRHVFVV